MLLLAGAKRFFAEKVLPELTTEDRLSRYDPDPDRAQQNLLNIHGEQESEPFHWVVNQKGLALFWRTMWI